MTAALSHRTFSSFNHPLFLVPFSSNETEIRSNTSGSPRLTDSTALT